MKIRFIRWFWIEGAGTTPRRVAIWKRNQQKKNDQVALFPEMQNHEPVEEKILALDARCREDQQKERDEMALIWRAARAMVRDMHPGRRAEFLGWWNECGYPCDAKSFMMYLKQYLEGRVNITARIQDLRYVRTLGFYKATGEHRRSRQWWLYGDPTTDQRDPRIHVYPYAEGAD